MIPLITVLLRPSPDITEIKERIKIYRYVEKIIKNKLTDDRKIHFQANKLQQLKPIHVRHVDVTYHNIEPVFTPTEK